MEKTESIFKVIHYMYSRYDIRRLRYPTFKAEWHECAYFKDLDDVERYVQHQAQMWNKAAEVFPVDSKIKVPLRLPIKRESLNYEG